MASQRVRRPEGPQDWETQRAVITDLYITKGLELEDLIKTMERDHFFKATKKQYKTHFTNWDLRKNVRPSEYNAIIKKKRKREEEGKDSAFRLRGALVNDSKIVRYEKKRTARKEYEIAEAGTPEDLSCFTPSPVASSPDAPSPVLRQFQSPNLLHSSIVSPSEQSLLLSSPLLLFFPEAPEFNVDRIFILVLLKKVFDIGSLCDFLTRLKPAPTDSGLRKYLIRLPISEITAPSDVRGFLSGLEVLVKERERQLVVRFSALTTRDLELKHNPPVRRSKSCESIGSIDSFLSDPVVDWKELLYGFNR